VSSSSIRKLTPPDLDFERGLIISESALPLFSGEKPMLVDGGGDGLTFATTMMGHILCL
jgi:hypothetical protein